MFRRVYATTPVQARSVPSCGISIDSIATSLDAAFRHGSSYFVGQPWRKFQRRRSWPTMLYAEAKRRGAIQEEILDELTSRVAGLDEVATSRVPTA